MYAERLILETDNQGNIKQMPKLPKNKQFETIFLLLQDKPIKREPHPDIVGKIKIMDNIFDSIPASDWNLS